MSTPDSSTVPEPNFAPRKEIIFEVTASNLPTYFNAGQPQKIRSKTALTGSAAE